MRNPIRRAALLAAALLTTAGSRAVADRPTAENIAQTARKAAESGDALLALSLWRKAAQEDDTYLPAKIAVAEHALRFGEPRVGLEGLRAVVAAAEADAALATAWPSELGQVRRRLANLEAACAVVDARVAQHTEALAALAERWVERDPEIARTALTALVRLRPDDAAAMDRLIALGGGGYEPLWNGVDSKGWIGMVSTQWSMADGVLTVNTTDSTAAATKALYSGDFDFRAELRVLEETGTLPVCTICLIRDASENESWGYYENRLVWIHRVANKETATLQIPPGDIDPPLDTRAWNKVEVRARGNTVEAWFNGKKRGEVPRENPTRGLALGLHVQDAKAQWRAIEWLERPH